LSFCFTAFMKITATAPTRIDLSGGTLDLWPLYLFFGGARTINVAVDLCASATIVPAEGRAVIIHSIDQNRTVEARSVDALAPDCELPLLARLILHFRPNCGFLLETHCQAPAGSGLGGSSSLAIAVCAALNRLTRSGRAEEELIAVARDVEAQVLSIPTGEQDYYAAVYGGVHSWRFQVARVERESYTFPATDLENRLLLLYTGVPRFSGINNWQVYRKCVDGERRTRDALAGIREQSEILHQALQQHDWETAFRAIGAEWEARRGLSDAISTPEIEELIAFGKLHGAAAGRVCGAGGGGCVVLLAASETQPNLRRLCREKGYTVLDCHAREAGLEVSEEA
jgi:D-glycero-alpha-D-manno-heptose-7-phosphate kinase